MVVEFALFLPVLLALIFGVVELGAAWYAKQMLVNASREGARMGAKFSQDGVTNLEVENEVIQILADSAYPGSFQVQASGADGSAGAPVRVVVTSEHQLVVLGGLVPGLPESITLTAVTVMRHE